jgi:hypothetical protein
MTKVRPRIGAPAAVSSTALSFPAELIHPPKSQVALSGDAVTDRVARLDTWAQQLGAGFGISFTNFELNPTAQPVNDNGWAIAASVLAALAHRQDRVSLERRGGRRGLYLTREPAVIAQDRRGETMLLKDAPLDVRERFLVRSEEFFREYLKLCQERLGRMRVAVEQADRTLELLNGMQLE